MSPDNNHLDNWISEYPKIKKYLEDKPELSMLFATTPVPQSTWNEAQWKKIVHSYNKSSS